MRDPTVSARWRALLLGGAALLAQPTLARSAAAQSGTATGDVLVTATTPLSDSGIAPAAQRATGTDIEAAIALDLSDFLNRRLGSVHVNTTQGNPLQPDVSYRGYTASPLLGTPQGLSVSVDGVRQNQPFGDIVAWDLIPREAIGRITLVPATDPLFGRNTLGGALAITTRDGRSDPGNAIEINAGSFGRRRAALTAGGASGQLDWFATANHWEERGWRDASRSDADQAFARLGWRDDRTELALTGTAASTDLNGNGLQELRLLAADRGSVYTRPDNTRNRALAATLTGRRTLSDAVTVRGNVFYRRIRTNTFNGDINDDSLGENLYQPTAAERAALVRAGYMGVPVAGESQANTPFPRFRCIANVLLNTEPNEKCNGLANRSRTRQRSLGANLEAQLALPIGERSNTLVFGGNYQEDRSRFGQSAQFGYLTSERGIVPVAGPGAFADGSQDSENAFDARVALRARTRGLSLLAGDTLDLGVVSLTGSLRYDHTAIDTADAITPGGGTGSLDGRHRYDRVNPALALQWQVSPALSLHASAAQTGRAPSAIELGCADPASPCRLPNALAGDPPLDQVVTRTLELGARGETSDGALAWRVTAFRGTNSRDILFVAADASGFGYFDNFGRTRRQGIELELEGRCGILSYGIHYTLLDATFRSAEEVDGSANSSSDGPAPGFEGEIEIAPGDRLPSIPRHILRADARLAITPSLMLGADVQAQTGMVARGNENGGHAPDGVYYIGPGATKGFAVADVDVSWTPTPRLRLYAQLLNAFDRRYSTGAQLAATGFAANGAFVARPFAGPVIDGERPLLGSTFYAPGSPRTLWLGVRVNLGRDR